MFRVSIFTSCRISVCSLSQYSNSTKFFLCSVPQFSTTCSFLYFPCHSVPQVAVFLYGLCVSVPLLYCESCNSCMLYVLFTINLKSYDQPDDGHELAETCRCILIRIYYLHTTVMLLTTFNIYNFYTHNMDDIP